MKILVVGAGSIGGYFGGRMLQAGADITFLVRSRRARELARDGLVIKSPHGDLTIPTPPTVEAVGLKQKYDVVLLSCKAFDLDDAILSVAPAVGDHTMIVPLLNGMKHLDVLDKTFGPERVLGGQCAIATTLNAQREVVQLAPMQSLSFGERDGSMSERVKGLATIIEAGNFSGTASPDILQEMWEKWAFLATLAGVTTSMRGPIGPIIAAPGGRDFVLGVRDECAAVAAAAGHALRDDNRARVESILTTEGSTMTASMFRDLQAGAAIEADHVIGDMIARADAAKSPAPRLRMIYTHLKVYEAQRKT
ncbi:MAG: 2-dehydropantoate 2-reductase [Tardiphaga sp.]|nr:2-dehydropantoate 2-reductase [Tardiphaga sp.]